jgi:PAS domain S-box-containing protein
MVIHWHYHPYVLLTVIAAVIAALVAFYSWLRRPAPGATALAMMMVAVSEWSLGLGVEIGGLDVSTKFLGFQIQVLGLYLLPVLWLLFTLRYTDRGDWVTPGRLVGLLVIPVLSMLLVWTHERHSLVFTEVWLNTATSPPTLAWRPGIWYLLYMFYAYLLLGLGMALLVLKLLRRPSMYRRQALGLLIALLLPWGTSALYLFNILPPDLPAGPVAFALSGLAFAWNLFKLRLLEIVPVARDVLVEQMRGAVIVVDAQGRLVDLNLAAQRLLGVEDQAVIGRPAPLVLPPEVAVHLHGDAPVSTEVMLGHGSERRYYNLRLTPLRWLGSSVRASLLLLHDITELKAAQQRAEAAARAKSQFVGNVSHELRTPLTSIRLYLDLLTCADSAQRVRYLDALTRETARLQSLIEDLLQISRLDLGTVTPEPELLDVNRLVHVLADDRRLLFTHRGLRLTVDVAPTLPEVRADPQLLEQVVTNLLTNALNYTPEGEVILSTAVAQAEGRKWVTIAVQDTGLGIREEERARLFERFYRGASSRQAQVPGTGLGLAISQEIVQLHGGHITCESAVEQGSTFTIWLPVP